MRKLDALLINPKNGLDFGAALTPPHSVLSVATELHSENFNVSVVDQRTDFSWKKSLMKELKKNPACVGISAITGVPIKYALEMAQFVREKTDNSFPIVWGGIHPSILPEQTLKSKYVDIVVRGEGEKTFKELLLALEKGTDLKKVRGISFFAKGKYIRTSDRCLLNINSLYNTAWELIDVNNYIQKNSILKGTKRELDIGETSRGCPFRCGFCYNSVFHKNRYRAMSSEKTFEKIRKNVEEFKLDCVWIRDDNFFTNFKRTKEIVKRLIKERLDIRWYASGIHVKIFKKTDDKSAKMLKRSGCEIFHFGAESGSDRILKMINKEIFVKDILNVNIKSKKYAITPAYSFMIGFPYETMKDILQTLSLIQRLKKENPDAKIHPIQIFTPYPKTPLFNLCEKLGFIPPNRLEDWARYNMSHVVSPTFSEKEKNIIRNIRDISQLSSDFIQFLPSYLKPPSYLIRKWTRWRCKQKYFRFAPEIRIISKLRDTVIT